MLLVDNGSVCLATVLIAESLIVEHPGGECAVQWRIRASTVRTESTIVIIYSTY